MFEPMAGAESPLAGVAELAAAELSSLAEMGTLDALVAWQRVAAAVEHRLLATAAHFADLRSRPAEEMHPGAGREQRVQFGGEGTPKVEEFAPADVAAELGMSDHRAEGLLADALDLRHRLPNVFAALARGEVEAWRARIVARGTRALSAALATDVEAEVLPRLGSLTPNRLRKVVAAAVIAADPAAADTEHEQARAHCRVTFDALVSGVTEIFGQLETPDALRLDARVDQVAGWLIELGDPRTKQVLRATALGLLADPDEVTRLWHKVCAHRGVIGQEPAERPLPATILYVHHRRGEDGVARWELEGDGPISQTQAQHLVGTGYVRLTPVIDLAEVISCAGYRPSKTLREQTVLIMPTCNAPYCDRPSRQGDHDHVVPFPKGATTSDNSARPCRRHHRIRTHGRWTLRLLARGQYHWRSPTNRHYLVTPNGTFKLGKVKGPAP